METWIETLFIILTYYVADPSHEHAKQRNANSRSEEQINREKLIANDYVNKIDKNSLICYTDGTALGNSGPCGAGVAIYTDFALNTPVLLKKPVSKMSISFHGEILKTVLNF